MKDVGPDLKRFLERGRELRFGARFGRHDRLKCRELFDKLFNGEFKYKIDQAYHGFESLIINLVAKETPVLLPLNKGWYTGKPLSYSAVNLFKEKLLETGLIDIKSGYFDRTNQGGSRTTRIWSSPILRDLFKGSHIQPDANTDLVELKTRKQRYKNGKIKKDKHGHDLTLNRPRKIQFKETGKTLRLRRELKLINRVNTNARIMLGSIPLDVHVRAVFSESFSYHGRLYTNGPNRFQQYSKADRLRIKINGDSVAELDYSGLHPRLLYALEKIQFDDDPYSLVHANHAVRPFLKVLLLAMINSPNFNAAQAAGNIWLNPEYVKDANGISVIKRYQDKTMEQGQRNQFKKQCSKAQAVKEIGITNAGPLIEKILNIHKPISKYLCNQNQTGMKLMNKDAGIALDVCKHFVKQGKPVLPIHDSFIVQEKYREELYLVMQSVYRKHMGGFTCQIN